MVPNLEADVTTKQRSQPITGKSGRFLNYNMLPYINENLLFSGRPDKPRKKLTKIATNPCTACPYQPGCRACVGFRYHYLRQHHRGNPVPCLLKKTILFDLYAVAAHTSTPSVDSSWIAGQPKFSASHPASHPFLLHSNCRFPRGR